MGNIDIRRRTQMVELVREVCDGSLVAKRTAVPGAAIRTDSHDISEPHGG